MNARQLIEAAVPTFFSVVLDEESQAQVRKLAIHPNVYGHHMTVAFRPDESELPKLRAVVGREYILNASRLAADEKGQALRVSGAPSLNKNPHVTVSCAEGTEPKYSNELLSHEQGEPVDLVLRGTLFEEPLDDDSSHHGPPTPPNPEATPGEAETGISR